MRYLHIVKYIQRISDQELLRKLDASGAVLVRGAKACGKTESAKQVAKSILQVDQNEQVDMLMSAAPERLLQGDTPRLIDEWQIQPKLWDYIRHEVDKRRMTGQFILTGSAQPIEEAKMHSGAGRFTIVDMRTMSWKELGISTGQVSMGDLLKGHFNLDVQDQGISLEFIIERLLIGGFPALIDKSVAQAKEINRAYIDLLAEADMSKVSGVKRDPIRVRNLLRSLARNTATVTAIKTLKRDIQDVDAADISRPTIYDYLDTLARLMIVEDQPAWNTHLRSSAALRKSPKRHFTDVCLAVAALGANEDSLFSDLRLTGFLFESMIIHDLRVYSQVHDAQVLHYQDSSGLEVDAIVQKYDGDWSAFEIKLGTRYIEEAASNLLKFQSKLDLQKVKAPKSLNIITGTGISYQRNDGINVISVASLGV